MDVDQFMEIVENSDKFEICKQLSNFDVMYKSADGLPSVIINDFLINPSKIGIKGKSINFWVNTSLLGADSDSDILLGSFDDVKYIKTLKIWLKIFNFVR